MKKTYLKPTTIQVAIKCRTSMLETSNGGGDKGNYVEGTQVSRRRGFWDDNEYEEY